MAYSRRLTAYYAISIAVILFTLVMSVYFYMNTGMRLYRGLIFVVAANLLFQCFFVYKIIVTNKRSIENKKYYAELGNDRVSKFERFCEWPGSQSLNTLYILELWDNFREYNAVINICLIISILWGMVFLIHFRYRVGLNKGKNNNCK